MKSKIEAYISDRLAKGLRSFAFCGGRRSGKTWGILTFLLLTARIRKTIVNIASMTAEQGRLGAYADSKAIMELHPATFKEAEVLSSPREIRFPNGSVIFFNSYQNSETAKGIACDYLFVNEANNFSKQQYTDLLANVRNGVFLDYNPNETFWVDDYFADEDICHTTWQDNPYLTPLQLEYFANLKRLAERDGASAVDIRNYRVYYLGEYSELKGDIFNTTNIVFGDRPEQLGRIRVFCDPSALRGADYFACVLSAQGADGKVYVLDTISVNGAEGETRESVCRRLRDWCVEWGCEDVYIETNGLVGIDFYEFAQGSGLPVIGWTSKGNKFERIVSAYGNITERVVFVESESNRQFVEQVYAFGQRCDHDDNIDALVSSYNLHNYLN